MPRIDFSGVKTLTPLSAGDYAATYVEAKFFEKSRSSGKPYVRISFTIDEEGDYKGRKLFRNFSLVEDALWAYKAVMITLGADPDDFDGEVDVEEMATGLYGTECVLSVDVKRQDDGTETNEVTRIREAQSFA